MRVALLACVASKQAVPAPARELYTSPLFKGMLQYALSQNIDKLFILSAEHGLVPADKVLAPYNTSLVTMPIAKRELWASRVLQSLREHTDIEHDTFIVLAGEKYRQFLVPHLHDVSIPMRGLGIGRQLAWLKQNA